MRWKYFGIQGFSEATEGFIKSFLLKPCRHKSVKFINFHDRNSEMSEFQVGREEEPGQARVPVCLGFVT